MPLGLLERLIRAFKVVSSIGLYSSRNINRVSNKVRNSWTLTAMPLFANPDCKSEILLLGTCPWTRCPHWTWCTHSPWLIEIRIARLQGTGIVPWKNRGEYLKSARWTSETAVCIASILLAARAYHYSPRRTSCNSAVFGFHLLPARCLTHVQSQLSPHYSNKRTKLITGSHRL